MPKKIDDWLNFKDESPYDSLPLNTTYKDIAKKNRIAGLIKTIKFQYTNQTLFRLYIAIQIILITLVIGMDFFSSSKYYGGNWNMLFDTGWHNNYGYNNGHKHIVSRESYIRFSDDLFGSRNW